MPRPLYATSAGADKRGDGHAGLWYDKFCDTWTVEHTRWSMTASAKAQAESPKLAWIQRVVGQVGHPDQVSEATHRQVLLAHARHGRFGVFTTDSRFVTGTGRSHPVENGFAWHPTLGTPYLPGSSIKGMIRRWAEEAGQSAKHILAAFGPDNRDHPDEHDDAEDPPVHGTETDAQESARDRIIVFDAIPVRPPHLEADVLTPHYAAWTPDVPPADWRSPVPVPFLVTAARTELVFAIGRADARSAGGTPDPETDLVAKVWQWLTGALEQRGAGAKTAVGYGRFSPADAATQRLAQRLAEHHAQARRAADMRTPEGRWRVALDGKPEPSVVSQVREQLKDGRLTAPIERGAFARAVLAGPFAQAWRTGKPTTSGLRQGSVPGGDKLKDLYRLLTEAANPKESTP